MSSIFFIKTYVILQNCCFSILKVLWTINLPFLEMIILNTNVGSFGDSNSLSDENKAVRAKFHDRLTQIAGTHGSVDVATVQECMSFDFKALPFFDKPLGHDRDTDFDDEAKRGVCTYASSGTHITIPNIKAEICVTSHIFKSHSKKKGYVDKKSSHFKFLPESAQRERLHC